MTTRPLRLLALTSTLALGAAACAAAAPPAADAQPASASAAVAAPEVASVPAPPPPPAASAAAAAPAEIAAPSAPRAKGFGRMGGARASAADAPAKAEAAVAEPAHQQGVRAGEWDDNANYREFQRWIASSRSLGAHAVDVSSRQFIVVRDADGKAVPRCGVLVKDRAEHAVALTTTASGRALLFPRAEGLVGDELTATPQCAGAAVPVRFSAAHADGIVDLKLATRRSAPRREVELGFVLDTTGSMAEEISAVKATIQKVAATLGADGATVKVGLVEYKDRSDEFVTRVYPMTSDLAKFSRDVDHLSAGGGGDYPESVNEGLHVALSGLDWGGSSAVKMAVLVGDAPPHLDYPGDYDYARDMKDASHRGIQVLTVAASGMDALGQMVWRQIAQYTDSTNLFLLRGAAGPQSMGAGDPLSSCGGAQTSFRSGNLDALVVERVRRELKNVDRDPMRIPGVGQDENAKPCGKRVQVAG
jgi:Mg-chelatase subunit ChlD